jgi:tight adherence protein C
MDFSQLPQLPDLSSSRLTLAMIGIAAAVGLYLLIKVVQLILRSRRQARTAPRRRPRAAQTASSLLKTSSEIDRGQTVQQVASESTATAEINGTNGAAQGKPAAPAAQPRQASTFWPVEPKSVEKKNLFEDVGVEYPYATHSDYRYGMLTPVLAELLPASEDGRRKETRTLRNAGYFEPHAWQNFAATRYLGIMLPLILVGILLVMAPERFEPYLIASLIIAPALGWALPALLVRSRAGERLRQVESALPDMLDLLNMCVSQGMTVPQSLARISREFAPVYPALSKELQIVAEQARVGNLVQALNNFSDRVDVPEVHSFTSLLIQTEQMGTSVSEALVEYSDSMRESQRQRADEKANAATFKLLFPTVLCLMPAVFLLLMGPALIELNRFFSNGGIQGLSRQADEVIERQR